MSKSSKYQQWKTLKQSLSDKIAERSFDREKYQDILKTNLLRLREVFKKESIETKNMVSTYQKYLRGESTAEEMEEANEQFRDLLRGLGLGVIVVLPFSPITIPLVVKLGQRLGIEVFPSAARSQRSNAKKNKS